MRHRPRRRNAAGNGALRAEEFPGNVRKPCRTQARPTCPWSDVLGICREHTMDDELARLFVTISHKLGHLIHYQHDPALRDIVVLKPDWLATAISFVLDDEVTRKAHGLVRLSRLSRLWDDPARPMDNTVSGGPSPDLSYA